MSYRAPPAVLPSLRPLPAPAAVRGLITAGRTSADRIQSALAVTDEARREHEARERAAAAPCPAGPSEPRVGGGDDHGEAWRLVRTLGDLAGPAPCSANGPLAPGRPVHG